jgi:putative oxidoreductase
VGETSTFLFLTTAATLVISVYVLWNRSVPRAQKTARGFYRLAVVVSVMALIWILVGILGVPENAGYARVLRLLLYRGWIVIGVGVCAVLLLSLQAVPGVDAIHSAAVRGFITSGYVIKGLCFSVSISFLCTEVGKLAHDSDMRQFFLQSGYAIWFLYFIMAAETAGAIGLLLPRTTLPAALGLMAIMAGAIHTHAHNHAPFSDSLEALHLLILLACIVAIRLLRASVPVAHSPAATTSDSAA